MLTMAIVVQAVLLAQAPAVSAQVKPSGGPCARYASPVPARIDGEITSLEARPLANIDVVATIAETGHQYSTTSDRQGHYSVKGFDAGACVHLEFRDPARRREYECTVRVQRSAPAPVIDVVLEAPQPGEPFGCQGETGPIFSTFLQEGPGVRRLTPAESKSYFPSEEEKPPVALNMRAADIQDVGFGEDGAALKLTPSGAEVLRALTQANVGRKMSFSIEGLPAGKWAIEGVIASGAAWVPAAELRGRLCEVLTTRPFVDVKPIVKIEIGPDDIASVQWQSFGNRVTGASVRFSTRGTAKLETERRTNPDRPFDVSIDGIHFLTMDPAMRLPRGDEWREASFGVGGVGRRLEVRLRAIEKAIQARPTR
jgi:hypothetical protein